MHKYSIIHKDVSACGKEHRVGQQPDDTDTDMQHVNTTRRENTCVVTGYNMYL